MLVQNFIAIYSTVTQKPNLKNTNVNMAAADDLGEMFCVANFTAFLQIAEIFSF